jgi:hypothetical protein
MALELFGRTTLTFLERLIACAHIWYLAKIGPAPICFFSMLKVWDWSAWTSDRKRGTLIGLTVVQKVTCRSLKFIVRSVFFIFLGYTTIMHLQEKAKELLIHCRFQRNRYGLKMATGVEVRLEPWV